VTGATSGYTILAADDEQELLDVLELYLAKDGITLLKAKDGREALERFRSHEVHLVLLDVMMPGPDGYSVLRAIRAASTVPAIMISARSADHDKILGLELGADDYVTKPFNPMEVAARVKAQLRRTYELNGHAPSAPLVVGDLALYPDEGRVERAGQPVALTSTEFRLLRFLMAAPGKVFTKRQLYEAVWQGQPCEADSAAVVVHLSNLRNKIEADPRRPQILKTIKGLGYKVVKEPGGASQTSP
jgi:DNA-binding response OmpR family regulator